MWRVLSVECFTLQNLTKWTSQKAIITCKIITLKRVIKVVKITWITGNYHFKSLITAHSKFFGSLNRKHFPSIFHVIKQFLKLALEAIETVLSSFNCTSLLKYLLLPVFPREFWTIVFFKYWKLFELWMITRIAVAGNRKSHVRYIIKCFRTFKRYLKLQYLELVGMFF